MEITQHYLKTREIKATINLFSKSKKLVFKEITNELSKSKQVQGVIPNVIHSLDSSHLIKVIIKAKNKGCFPFVSVHDCFGTHPNKMDLLLQLVKSEFVIIYSKGDFLETFHRNIIKSIKLNNIKMKKVDSDYYAFVDSVDE